MENDGVQYINTDFKDIKNEQRCLRNGVKLINN